MKSNDKQLWLSEAIALVPEAYRPDDVQGYLTDALKRCHAQSKKTFWQWLRITLAKFPESAVYLTWMQECRVPVEVAPIKQDDFPHKISADGTTALIQVGDDTAHGIWKIPASQLSWAKEMMPVFLKRLPDLEPPELKRQREIRHQARYMKRKLSQEQLKSFEQELADLDAQVARLYPPVPRFCLMRWTPKRDIPVHRLFTGVDDDTEIEPIDGDFLNYCTVKVQVTLDPVADEDGIAGGRGTTETRIIEVNNFRIVPMSPDKQEKFEDGHFQYRYVVNKNGIETSEVDESPLRVRPNADLGRRTGVEGRIEDCGAFHPLTARETIKFGLQPEIQSTRLAERQAVDRIRRKWRVKEGISRW